MNNRRAVSGVITTLLLITVAIVAIGIVAFVILNAVEQGEQTIDYGQKCLGAQFKIKSATFNNQGTTGSTGDDTGDDTCDVVIERTLGLATEAVNGIVVTVNNDATNYQIDTASDLVSTATINVPCDGISATADITQVDGIPYLEKEDGSKHQCGAFSLTPQ